MALLLALLDHCRSAKSKTTCLNVEIGEPSSREIVEDLPEWASTVVYIMNYLRLDIKTFYMNSNDCTYPYLHDLCMEVCTYCLHDLLFTTYYYRCGVLIM